MGKKSNQPKTDPQALIQQQAEQNRLAGFTPQGNLVYGSVGTGGTFQPRDSGAAYQVQETPFQERYRQGFEDLATIAQQTAAPRVQNLPLAPFDVTQFPDRKFEIDYSGIDAVPTSANFSQDAQRVEDATFQRMKGLLDPAFAEQTEGLENRLVHQGLPMGSEAFDTEFQKLRRSQNEQLSKAALDSVGAGRAEQSRLFGQALTSRGAQLQDEVQDINLLNTGRAQAIQEGQALRSTELGELAGLLGLQPVQPVQAQSFFAPSAVDVMGPYQLQAQQAAMAQQSANQQMAGLLGGVTRLGAAAVPFAFGRYGGGG